MSSIDAVIARSRQPGAMSSRKRFTVSRKRAIQKLRQFALADPHAYVLELIQAAIANGAAYVDLQTGKETVTLSYIGGGLREDELAQLFDFLFASKDRRDVAHVRALALGLNAALRFEPELIIVESGDGSHAGTTRMSLRPGSDEVEIGKPVVPLAGTYVRIEGMKRKALGAAWRNHANADPVREVGLIETRCLTAPIPIMVDGEPKFGFGALRIPRLGGYRRTLQIDEGDLYGMIGIDPGWGTPSFQLLTYGVHIASKSCDFIAPGRKEGPAIGGILCFDALHKTVDHSNIVEDERYEEMWARVWPYVRQLTRGGDASRSPYEVSLLGHDEPLSIPLLRDLLINSPRVVCVERDDPNGAQAEIIGQHLDAPVLCVHSGSVDDLRALAGAGLQIVQPWMVEGGDLSIYTRPMRGEPPRPWVVESVEAESAPVEAFVDALAPGLSASGGVGEHSARALLQECLGTLPPTVRVYLPDSQIGLVASRIELRVCDRLVAARDCPELPEGRIIVVEFPELSPARLAKALKFELAADGTGWAGAIEELVDVLDEQIDVAVSRLGDAVLARLVKGGARTPAARALALQALAQKMLPVLTFDAATPQLELWSLAGDELGLDLPLFRVHGPQQVVWSLRELTAELAEGDGLIFASTPEVHADLTGLDEGRVLSLEIGQEPYLLELFGDAGYVRVDVREHLARAGAFVVRDRAPGIDPMAAGGLPVEAAHRASGSYDEQLEGALATQLLRRALGQLGERPSDPGASEDWEVCRREAAGHLRAYLCRAGTQGQPLLPEAASAGLFVDTEARVWSFEGLARLAERGRLSCVYGNPDAGGLSALTEGEVDPAWSGWVTLPVDLFTAKALASVFELGTRAGDEDEDEDDAEIEMATQLASGAMARLRLLDREHQASALVAVHRDGSLEQSSIMLAARYGVRGVIDRRRSDSEAASLIAGAARALWAKAVGRLRKHGVNEAEGLRIADLALLVIERSLRVSRTEGQGVRYEIHDPLAQELSRLPLFELRSGGRVSPRGVIRRANRLRSDDPRPRLREQLANDNPRALLAFVDRALAPERAVVQRGFEYSSTRVLEGELQVPLNATTLASSVKSWINALRPDADRLEHCFAVYFDDGLDPIEGSATSVRFNLEDPRVTTLTFARQEDDPILGEGFATLLLSIYARMNLFCESITLDHELIFQRRVLTALAGGHLHACRVPGQAAVEV